MRIAVPHNMDKATARRKIDARLQQLLATYGSYLSDVEQRWEGDRLVFAGKTKGMKASGTVDVTENEIIVEGKVPLLAKPFEPRIKSTIEREAAAMFS
jgi:putative polyhydroxyalkanoate system protein